MVNFVLTESDIAELKKKYEVTETQDFLRYFTAKVNSRRIQMKNDLLLTNPSSPLINRLSSPIEPTINTVKHFARKHKWKKAVHFISSLNRNKAVRKRDLDLAKDAKLVTNPTDWLRTIEIGQTLVGKFESMKKMKSVNSILVRWNHTEGTQLGMFISAKYFWDCQVIKITAKKEKCDGRRS